MIHPGVSFPRRNRLRLWDGLVVLACRKAVRWVMDWKRERCGRWSGSKSLFSRKGGSRERLVYTARKKEGDEFALVFGLGLFPPLLLLAIVTLSLRKVPVVRLFAMEMKKIGGCTH